MLEQAIPDCLRRVECCSADNVDVAVVVAVVVVVVVVVVAVVKYTEYYLHNL